MADKKKLAKLQKKSVEIKVEGETYHLRYDLNALIKLEDAYENIQEAFSFEENPVGAMGKLRKVLWVGLNANHPSITEEEVGEMFTIENIAEFQEAIGTAMNAAMPEEVDAKNSKTPKDHLPKTKK
jgi:hypothetical protein